MPVYRYVCKCGIQCDAWRTVGERDQAPEHCGAPMERRILPTAIAVFEPYRAVASDKETGERPLIRSRSEHEAFLRRNDYVEVGNDAQMRPKTEEEIAHLRTRREQNERAAPVLSEQDLIRDGWIANEAAL